MAQLNIPQIAQRTGVLVHDADVMYRWILLLLNSAGDMAVTGVQVLEYFTSVPTIDEVPDGTVGFSLINGVLSAHVNDGGILKNLGLGEPG